MPKRLDSTPGGSAERSAKKTSKEKFPIKKSSESSLSDMGKPLGNGTSKRMSKQSVHTRVRHWFVAGVNAALLAPTAFGKQNFLISGKGQKVTLRCDTCGEDLGLVKYHFELGAGKENFEWEWSL